MTQVRRFPWQGQALLRRTRYFNENSRLDIFTMLRFLLGAENIHSRTYRPTKGRKIVRKGKLRPRRNRYSIPSASCCKTTREAARGFLAYSKALRFIRILYLENLARSQHAGAEKDTPLSSIEHIESFPETWKSCNASDGHL